ncbi:MAG: ferrous iron transport protein A [Gammaproteobacteria bacterium]|nr:ferrous iron transport protein A [Gammaproteobacteria bacterium]
MTLNHLQKGQFAIVTGINADKELKDRFNSFGLVKGAEIHVGQFSLAKQTMEVRINKTRMALRTSEAEKVEVNNENH